MMRTVNLNFNTVTVTVTLCRGWILSVPSTVPPPLRIILKPNTCNTLKPNEFSSPARGHRWLQSIAAAFALQKRAAKSHLDDFD